MPSVPVADKIRIGVAAGFSISAAVKGALEDGGLSAFAERHGITRTEVSACLIGQQRCERVRVALVAELGLDRDWLDQQLDLAMAARRALVESGAGAETVEAKAS